ncbi:type III secretory pathway component EscU [Parvibaculum indicum]|uniref:hypothetical protein n=1 Tax=Parvibaculum indicum TaxID=562969 RepID=UPI0014229546|nr:hypothetical protein [Parvibaculum indicum]NIJ41991.1 type III secretory pathway component EscU [Parvibaculum indicum]
MQRIVIAVLLAGIAGTVANALAAMVIGGVEKWSLMLMPARYAIACLIAVLLPAIFRYTRPTLGVVVAAVVLTGIPSLNAKLVLGVGAPWFNVLLLNAVYAAVAMLVYLAISGDLTRRHR